MASLLAAVIVLISFAQFSPAQEDAVSTRLRNIAQEQRVEDPVLGAWHLQLAVQLFDAKGKPAEKGTVDYWWAGPEKYKRVYAMPSYTATEVKNASGLLHTPGTPNAPYVLSELLQMVTNPVSIDNQLAGSTPTLVQRKLGASKFDCIIMDRKLAGIKDPPLGLYPTYCVLPGTNSLVMQADISEITGLRAIGSYGNKHYPADLDLELAGVKVASAHVVSLRPVAPTSPEFDATDGLTSADEKVVRVASGTVAGNAINRPDPIYPGAARQRRASGTVVLHAVIGTDGAVRRVSLVSAPDPDLAIAAALAVRQWTYRPYFLNGVPVTVETTVNVNSEIH